MSTYRPCPNTGGVFYAREHLAELPQSQTSPVKWCPVCLGLGFIRTARPVELGRLT